MLAFASLLHLQSRFPELLTIAAEWLSARTQQHWNARRLLDTAVWKYPLIEVRTATAQPLDRTVWVLQVNTRDARVPGRDWQFELALRAVEQGGVDATVVVQANDDRRSGHAAAPVPFSQPALVRALLARGEPDPNTPGLQPIPLESGTDAQALVARVVDPRRSHALVVLCQGEAPLDVPALRAAVVGQAEVVELRSGLSSDISAILKSASVCSSPGRATVFPPPTTTARGAEQARRQLLGADARTLTAAVLKLCAPRILAAHLSLEKIKDASPAIALADVSTA